jgi:hypothetical protein
MVVEVRASSAGTVVTLGTLRCGRTTREQGGEHGCLAVTDDDFLGLPSSGRGTERQGMGGEMLEPTQALTRASMGVQVRA